MTPATTSRPSIEPDPAHPVIAGEPGERPDVPAGYYAAFVLDPDGNNVEVVEQHRG